MANLEALHAYKAIGPLQFSSGLATYRIVEIFAGAKFRGVATQAFRRNFRGSNFHASAPRRETTPTVS